MTGDRDGRCWPFREDPISGFEHCAPPLLGTTLSSSLAGKSPEADKPQQHSKKSVIERERERKTERERESAHKDWRCSKVC